MKIENTFTAKIYVGAKEHYDDKVHTYEETKQICQNYCGNVPLCVTIEKTEYIYKNGNEIGFIIGLINYPRFPSTPEEITQKAIALAEIFKEKFNQYRVTIICSDQTYMLE